MLTQIGGGRVTDGIYSVRVLSRSEGASRSGVYVDNVSVTVLGMGLDRDSRLEGLRGTEYVSERAGEC